MVEELKSSVKSHMDVPKTFSALDGRTMQDKGRTGWVAFLTEDEREASKNNKHHPALVKRLAIHSEMATGLDTTRSGAENPQVVHYGIGKFPHFFCSE